MRYAEGPRAGVHDAVRTTVDAEGAADTILAALDDADRTGEKVVIHCSGGSARTSLGLGLWLASRHGLSAEEAAKAITEHALLMKQFRQTRAGVDDARRAARAKIPFVTKVDAGATSVSQALSAGRAPPT